MIEGVILFEERMSLELSTVFVTNAPPKDKKIQCNLHLWERNPQEVISNNAKQSAARMKTYRMKLSAHQAVHTRGSRRS